VGVEYSLVGEERARDIVNLDVSHCAIPSESLRVWRAGERKRGGEGSVPSSATSINSVIRLTYCRNSGR
jgi:hypothetical protein